MLFGRLPCAVADKGRTAYIIAGSYDSSERCSPERLQLGV